MEQKTQPTEQKQWVTYSFKNKPTRKKFISKQPSLTIPDETLTMRQLLDNHTRGINPAIAKTPIYAEIEGFDQGINPRTLDLVDIQGRKLQNKAELERLDKAAKDEQEQHKLNLEAKSKAKKEALKEEIRKEMLESEKNQLKQES